MSNENNARHMPPQHVENATPGPFWPNDAAADASSDESTLSHGISDGWLLSEGYTGIYNNEDSLALPTGDDGYLFDESRFYEPTDTSSAQYPGLNYVPNALGLDPVTASSRTQMQMGRGVSAHPDHLTPSHHARMQHLPQIVTSDLRSPASTFPHSPIMHSPSDYPNGPYSAFSPSPASSVHNMPVTPASLPLSSNLVPPYINSGTLLSPSSPFIYHQYGSPASKSAYSPSPSGHASPRMLSYSPTDEVGPVNHAPRQPHQTVHDLAAAFPNILQSMVPQRTYRPHTQSDRRRYVEEVDLEAPIMFYMTHPDSVGIPCRDALNCRFARLVGRDDQMFINRGPSVSIRLMWPGYAPWSRQIPTRDFRSPPGPITRSKLAKNVAKTVQRFIEDMRAKPMEEDADPVWRVGGARITIEDLELVGLQHVSMGSWQAHIRVRHRS